MVLVTSALPSIVKAGQICQYRRSPLCVNCQGQTASSSSDGQFFDLRKHAGGLLENTIIVASKVAFPSVKQYDAFSTSPECSAGATRSQQIACSQTSTIQQVIQVGLTQTNKYPKKTSPRSIYPTKRPGFDHCTGHREQVLTPKALFWKITSWIAALASCAKSTAPPPCQKVEAVSFS